MKKRKIIVLISFVFILIIVSIFNLYSNNTVNIDKLLKSKNYSYLSNNVKEYIKNYYNETGEILLTEKNKEKDKDYLNPDYIEYLDGEFENTQGYIPDVLTRDYNYKFNSEVVKEENLPSKFDSRNVNGNNYVTPTKRQFGELCWNYAFTSVIESKLLKEGLKTDPMTLNLSERMMDYATTNPIAAIDIEKNPYFGNYTLMSLSEGGNEYRYASALINGVFPISEDIWNYDLEYMGKVSPEYIYDFNKNTYQVNEVKYIKDNNLNVGFDEDTNKILKQSIIDNGSVGVSLRVGAGKNFVRYKASKDELLNTDTEYNYIYYKPSNAQYQSNDHMVSLIGWDDEYTHKVCIAEETGELSEPTNNDGEYTCTTGVLKTINGAWITKDSANSSYHYLAYETVNSTYFTVDDISEINWDNVYPASNNDIVTRKDFKYTFTKQNNIEKITSIKFTSQNAIPNVKVYLDTNDGTEEKLLTEVKTDVGGIYTIEIDEEILLSSTEFSIRFSSYHISNFTVFTNNVSETPLLNMENTTLINSFNYQDLLNGYQNVIVTNGISKNLNEEISYIIKDNNENDVTNLFDIKRKKPIGNYVYSIIRYNNIPLGEYTAYQYVNNKLLDTFKININFYMEKINGDGSLENPYIITNPTQLDMMRLNKYNYYKLGNDIDLTYDTQNENGLFYNDGLGWEPISYSDCTTSNYVKVNCSQGYSGGFDGDSHKIIGLYINRPNEDVVGLFRNTYNDNYSGLNFSNLTLKDVDITGRDYVGGVIGYAYGTTYERTLIFENITITGKIKGNNYVGGVVGYFKGGTGLNNYVLPNTKCVKRHCLQSILNSATIEGNNYVGGIVGLLETQDYNNENNASWRSTIDFNYLQNNGTIISNENGAGLFGHISIFNGNTVTISNSINTGKINSENQAAITPNSECTNKDATYPNCSIVFNNIYHTNEKAYNENNLITSQNVTKYNISDLTNPSIFSLFTKFNDYYTIESINGINRIPLIKTAYKEYVNAENITINNPNGVNIYDFITGNKESIIYVIENDEIATIDSNGLITPKKDGITKINITSNYDGYNKDINLTVDLESMEYTITYDLDGGEATNPGTYTKKTETFILNNPTKEGYEFIGWTGSNGEELELEVAITKGTTGNLTYKANYEPLKFNITFNSNSGTGSMNSQTFTFDIYQKITKNTFTKEGYTFTGWNTRIDNTGTSYTDEQNIKITEDITLYAMWEEKPAYVIENYQVDETNNIIKDIPINTSEEEFLKNIKLSEVCTIEIEKQKDYIGTTSIIKIYKNDELHKEFTAVVKGELTGDGVITLADLSKFYNYYQKNITMNNYFELAADVNGDGKFTLADLSKYYNYYQGNINNL